MWKCAFSKKSAYFVTKITSIIKVFHRFLRKKWLFHNFLFSIALINLFKTNAVYTNTPPLPQKKSAHGGLVYITKTSLDWAKAPTLWLGYKNEQTHFCNARLLSCLQGYAFQDDVLHYLFGWSVILERSEGIHYFGGIAFWKCSLSSFVCRRFAPFSRLSLYALPVVIWYAKRLRTSSRYLM